MQKPVVKKQKLVAEDYVNTKTGETLGSELKAKRPVSVSIQNEELSLISSSEYIVIDSKALLYIQKHLDKVDLARVLEMCNMVDGSCYNVLINRKTKELHSKSSLMTELEYSRNKFAILMKKLYDKSIISYMKSVKDGKEQLVVLLNPFLARKSKTFHKECLLLFEDLSKK